MKRIIALISIFTLITASAFAVPFAPELLKFSAEPVILYDFDGSTLTVPVTVTGKPASALFTVFTKDRGSSISNVVNGFLGWHHVNKIDTCVYLSKMTQMDRGSNAFQWDGKNENGGIVPAGEYTYYIWGYDNMTPRIQVTKFFKMDPWNYRTFITTDMAGAPLAQPIVYTGTGSRSATRVEPIKMTNKRWVIGADPADSLMLETTSTMQIFGCGGLSFDPKNSSKFFILDQITGGIEIKKMTWVPNGAAISDAEDQTWGDNGRFFYTTTHAPKGVWGPGTVSDGKDYLWAVNADGYSNSTTISELIYLDINDGSEIKRLDLSPWWVDMNDGLAGGQATGGPSEVYLRNNMLFLGSHSTCINQCIDPYYEEEEDAFLWTNGNGDHVGDHNDTDTSKLPWVCNDYNVGPYKYNIVADANNFSMFPAYDMGAVSFGLYLPDGTGVDYLTLAGETAYIKNGMEYIDYDSPYDGIYTTNNMNSTADNKGAIDNTLWFVGHDSIKGTITNMVAVKDFAPIAFTVAQNSPNPFNPTTTISFTLAKAGKTTVEVYNVAGQKVGTLVNGSMSAGSHSVVWNAANFSAGVYFYTIKSGSFSKTMKMTLLK